MPGFVTSVRLSVPSGHCGKTSVCRLWFSCHLASVFRLVVIKTHSLSSHRLLFFVPLRVFSPHWGVDSSLPCHRRVP